MSTEAVKTCKECGIEQPIHNFPSGHAPGRKACRCRPCHRAWKRRFEEGSRRMTQRAGEIPSGPFVAWLREYVARFPQVSQASQELGFNPRIVWRWTHRPSPFVEETTVDRMFCAAGEPYLLRELYSELYPGSEEMAA